jgi:hypothetical protein
VAVGVGVGVSVSVGVGVGGMYIIYQKNIFFILLQCPIVWIMIISQ